MESKLTFLMSTAKDSFSGKPCYSDCRAFVSISVFCTVYTLQKKFSGLSKDDVCRATFFA